MRGYREELIVSITEYVSAGGKMEHNYIQEALAFYNITASEIELLRHNENLTYRVGNEYLLQIHEPAEGFTAQFAEIYYSKMISLKGLGI